MKKMKYFLIAFLFLPGCQFFKSRNQANNENPKRVIAQTTDSRYHSTKIITTFNELMNEPLYTTDANGQTIQFFINHARKYVLHQFDFLYIGQSLMPCPAA